MQCRCQEKNEFGVVYAFKEQNTTRKSAQYIMFQLMIPSILRNNNIMFTVKITQQREGKQ